MTALDLTHLSELKQHLFSSTGHSFGLGNTSVFINAVTADIAAEADKQEFLENYISRHKSNLMAPSCFRIRTGISKMCGGKFHQVQCRLSSKLMPKHFRVDQHYSSRQGSGKQSYYRYLRSHFICNTAS